MILPPEQLGIERHHRRNLCKLMCVVRDLHITKTLQVPYKVTWNQEKFFSDPTSWLSPDLYNFSVQAARTRIGVVRHCYLCLAGHCLVGGMPEPEAEPGEAEQWSDYTERVFGLPCSSLASEDRSRRSPAALAEHMWAWLFGSGHVNDASAALLRTHLFLSRGAEFVVDRVREFAQVPSDELFDLDRMDEVGIDEILPDYNLEIIDWGEVEAIAAEPAEPTTTEPCPE